MGTSTRDLIDQVARGRAASLAELEGIVDRANGRRLSAAETRQYDATKADLEAFDARLDRLEDEARREGSAGAASRKFGSGVRVTSEPMTYGKFSEHSYFGDLLARQSRGDSQANERLMRHAREMSIEARGNPLLEERALTRTDTTSVGEFVPPMWLVDEYGPALRAGRPTADLCTKMELPAGTDSINVPTLAAGTAVGTLTGVQTADNAALANQDAVSNTVTAHVNTIGGYEDVALQVIEQSPIGGGFDGLIFQDLLADYSKRLDLQVLNGSGGSGQSTGILGTAGISSITYTQATPTLQTHFPVIAQLKSAVDRLRFLPAQAIVMSPSRFNWMASTLDTTGHPLIAFEGAGPNNAVATLEMGDVGQGGPAGWLLGLPIYLDANVPNNVGGATNEDRIIVGRFTDAYLWEGPIRVSAHPDVLAHQAEMRLRLYRYFAFTAGRIPASFATATGTGNIVTTVLAAF